MQGVGLITQMLAQQVLADVTKQTVRLHYIVVCHGQSIDSLQWLSLFVVDVKVELDGISVCSGIPSDGYLRIHVCKHLVGYAMPSGTLPTHHREGLVTKLFCGEVAHPLGIGHQGIDTAFQRLRQQYPVGKHTVLVASNHHALHQRVGLLVV